MGFFRKLFQLSRPKPLDAKEQAKPLPKQPSSPTRSKPKSPSTKSPIKDTSGDHSSVKPNVNENMSNLGFTTPVDNRPKPANMTVAENLVYDWLMAFQNHDMAKLEELTDITSVFVFEEANGDNLEFRCRDILAVAGNFWEGFPDCAYGWDSIHEGAKDDNDNITVTLANWRWFGHHTGVPYIHEPYPPIPAEGKYILDGPLMMTFRIGKDDTNDKLHIKRTEAKGRNMGPHGTYEKLGGMII